MRIAFVGKGGAGKSTTSALYFLHLLAQGKNSVIFDADLNIHIPGLLGLDFDESKSISLPAIASKIKDHLIGDSELIESAEHFYKTTPPSTGTNSFTINDDDFVIDLVAEPFKSGYVAAVGTYEADEIGRSCYHTNLAVFENILSFARLDDDDYLVADMVAGIDAFSNTLHQQFDILVLAVEPTRESIDVLNQYNELAEHAGVRDRLFVIGNKLEDNDDAAFLEAHIDKDQYLGGLRRSKELKLSRQAGKPLDIAMISDSDVAILEKITATARKHQRSDHDRLEALHQLHAKYIDQDYVKNAVGDLSHQIDPEFTF